MCSVSVLQEEAKDLIVHHIEQINLNRPSPTRNGEAPKEKEYALIIDGKTLAFALHDSASKKGFLNLTKKCNSVVCCRATPLQKVEIVMPCSGYLPLSPTLCHESIRGSGVA